jgi:hypothetical protein
MPTKPIMDAGVHFAIRMSMRAHPQDFYYDVERKHSLRLLIAPINKPKLYHQVYYMGEVFLNGDE